MDVEIVEPAGGPENVERVASGTTDFCLTSVAHFLRAQQGRYLAARFVAIIAQRSPMAALVTADSDMWAPSDLGNRRLGAPSDSGLTAQYQAALVHLGESRSDLVPMPYADAPGALGRGEIDIVPDYVDLLPRTRRQAGVALRAVPVGPEIYSSGLVAADSLSADLVAQMRIAIVAALELQRAHPRFGLEALCARYPGVDPDDALEGWSLAEPNIFGCAEIGSMDAARWQSTLDHLCAAHNMSALAPDAVYRSEFLATDHEFVEGTETRHRLG